MKQKQPHKKLRLFASFGGFLSTFLVIGALVACATYLYLEQQLPDVEVLKDIQLQVPMRIYSSDNKLIAEFGNKRRIPVPIQQIPKQLINAVLATEDQRFYEHPGVDLFGLMRAAGQLIMTGQKEQGGSTITMQVARNFFLTRRKTYTRKLKEILLAIKIDRELSKDKILELYLNKIYLGNRAYGVGAAAQVYYGKPLAKLTLPQLAMIAGLPKAPSAINPLANPVAAKKRRNHVLERMHEQGYIDFDTYQKALNTPLTAKYHGLSTQVYAPYVAEIIRKELLAQYGKAAYTHGLNVYTTVNSKLQNAANQALRENLIAYDRRHGYRGPEHNLGIPNAKNRTQWQGSLRQIPTINGLQAAAILQLDQQSAQALLADDTVITIPWQGLSWARRELANNKYRGPQPKQASDILQLGDVIRVNETKKGQWQLAQVPQVEGAQVALNPKNGAITALVGGFDFRRSKFDRVTQAMRQPGSNFKPFIYSAALSKGFTLASLINDAPVVLNDSGQEELWRPQNDTRRFYGPTRLRIGLIKSRNLVSIRLLEMIGIPYARNYITRFGFQSDQLPNGLSLALGSGLVTPLEIADGYATFANGGYKVTPFIIDHITDTQGQLVYQIQPTIACETCIADNSTATTKTNSAPRVITPQNAYLITSALQDVIQAGTGRAARVLKRSDIAGKTGTTNKQIDAWFSGYNGDIVATSWVGFDQPRSLYEYGAQAALPMWIAFMKVALNATPLATLPQPPDIVTMRIDRKTGLPTDASDKDSTFEIFRAQNAPRKTMTAANDHSTDAADGSNQTLEQLF